MLTLVESKLSLDEEEKPLRDVRPWVRSDSSIAALFTWFSRGEHA